MHFVTRLRYRLRYRNWREITGRSRGENPRRVVLRNGTVFDAPSNINPALIVNAVFFRRRYSPPGFDIGPQDVVLDVGANIGVFSIFAASRTAGRVVAIEPCPINIEYLRRNIKANSARVEVVPRAASCRSPGGPRTIQTSRRAMGVPPAASYRS